MKFMNVFNKWISEYELSKVKEGKWFSNEIMGETKKDEKGGFLICFVKWGFKYTLRGWRKRRKRSFL